VIRAAHPARPDAPKRGRKDHNGQQEEHAHHFKPNDSSHAAEGAQKATHAARNRPGGDACRPAGSCSILACGPVPGGHGWRRTRGSRWCLRSGRSALSCNASSNAQADAQGTADGAWFHPIYDGSSPFVVPFFNICCRFFSCSGTETVVR